MRLTGHQLGVVLDVEMICAQETDSRVLRQRVTARLARVLQWDAACFSTIDPSTMLITDHVSEGIPSHVYALAAYNEYLVHDVNKFTTLARSSTGVAILGHLAEEQQEASPRLRTILPILDARHEVRAVCVVDGQCWGGLALFRTGDRPDFSLEEAALLQAICPLLAAGLRRTAYRAQVRTGTLADVGPGVLVLNKDNETQLANEAAQQYLDELAPAAGRGGGLPYAVHQVAARARVSLPHSRVSPSAQGRLVDAYSRVQARSGRWLALHGSPVGDGQDRDKGVAVVVEPAPSSDIAELLMLVHGLTNRERQVLQRVIAGGSSTAISAQLHISVHTVQDHLKSIFAKVGVRSRGQLVATILEQGLSDQAATSQRP
ncbi:LuxR C-terminal-related transcriptional regulator [Streptomyces sp. NPDC052051]|uniref:LuxR C-terminal-related transcriptional regulator n=1 Tax=Streptomyces sp. NPDC052051 TaxID=3154649 RepID=UPI00341952A6